MNSTSDMRGPNNRIVSETATNSFFYDILRKDATEEPWKFQYAWKWFDLHVKHRNTMFNFWALFVGVLANAYVESLHKAPHVAPWIAGMVTTLTIMFFFLHIITVIKIQLGKKAMSELYLPPIPPQMFDQLFGVTEKRIEEAGVLGIDPFWTSLVHIVITCIAFIGVIHHFPELRPYLLGVGFIIVGTMASYLRFVLKNWFSGPILKKGNAGTKA